MIFEAAQSIQG